MSTISVSKIGGQNLIQISDAKKIFSFNSEFKNDFIGKNDRFFYAFNKNTKRLNVYSTDGELSSISDEKSNFSYLQLDFSEHIKFMPSDFVFYNYKDLGRFFWSEKNKDGSINIFGQNIMFKNHAYSFSEQSYSMDQEDFKNEVNSTQNILYSHQVEFNSPIRGNGNFIILRDNDQLIDILLSYDPLNNLIHRYNITPSSELNYDKSYDIGYILNHEEVVDLNNWKLSVSFDPSSRFSLVKENKKISLSLNKLEEHFQMNRLYFISRFKNETLGNSWSKSFWFLGLCNSLIDILDHQWGNPHEDIEGISLPLPLKELVSDLRDNDILEWIESTPLLTNDEKAVLHYSFVNEKTSGYRWFAITATVGILLGKTHFIGSIAERTQVMTRFRQQVKKLVFSLRQHSSLARRATDNFDKFALKLKKRIIRNIQNSRYPQHLVDLLDDHLRHALKKYNHTVSKDKIINISEKVPKYYERRVQEILYLWQKLPKEYTHKYAQDFEKLTIYSKKGALESRLNKIKAKVLILYRKSGKTFYQDGSPVKSIKDNHALGYINATDKEYILAIAREVLVKGKFKTNETKKIYAELSTLIDDLDDVKKIIDSWPLKKDVALGYELVAIASRWYARYMLPEAVYRFNPKNFPKYHQFMKFVDNNLRKDRITLPNGSVEKIVVTGEDAKRAVTIGMVDQIIDTTTQWYARKNLTESERIFGDTDNHVRVYGNWGVHIDLIASRFVSLTAWCLGMPVSFAQYNMNFGQKGEIGLINRLVNSTARKIINLPWTNFTLVWPAWTISKNLAIENYKKHHADDFSQKDFENFLHLLEQRTTQIDSFLKREFFRNTVGTVYQNPQYFIQAEIKEMSRLMFTDQKYTRWFERIVIPATSSLFLHKWWSNYFAENNIILEEVIAMFQLKGFLDKYKLNDHLKIEDLTELEREKVLEFFQLVSLIKREKTHPLPEDPTQEELVNWYADFVVETYDLKESNSQKFDFKEEIKDLYKRLDQVKHRMRPIPFEKKTVRVITKENNKKLDDMNLYEEFLTLQSKVSKLLKVKNDNLETFKKLQSDSYWLNVVDVLIWADLLFNRRDLPDKIKKSTRNISNNIKNILSKRFNIKFKSYNSDFTIREVKRSITPEHPIHNLIDKYATRVAFISLPTFLLTVDQREAHSSIQEEINLVLLNMQKLLFNLTREIVFSEIEKSLTQESFHAEQLRNFLKSTTELKEKMEKTLAETHAHHNKLRVEQENRWAQIWYELTPITILTTSAWMLTRYTLFRASKGVFTRLTDPYVKLFLKGSLVAFPYTMEAVSQLEELFTLTTHDFFTLINTYQIICVQELYLKKALEGEKDIDLKEFLDEIKTDNKFLVQMEEYQNKIIEISNGLDLSEFEDKVPKDE
ncbi:MAG: hypothetical protein H6622_16465 [Halobacteriovoraceae bacterium]|nr:hypothetical protein [Halobacteriovoraceae bacterium]